ncbi:bifunctional DNA primase/polymerase [Acidocella sp. MX-AZ03]|uniref:bifunctional DNA primase/polymerase n=1 Tax=Acidocella sp. MX-AZ03 TaxID=2697363 RepID=UPI0022DD2D2F|nr:bifunctional DNA primase/polymerase [Acidocella sp. MX-AZ03]WBO58048.1 bifunctional DNA primase/polymerase [Acidocella sp. MX-AZ03]
MSNDQTRAGAADSIGQASRTPDVSEMASGAGAAAAHPAEVSGGEGGERPPAKVSTALGEAAERALDDLRRRLEGGDAAFMDGAAKLCLPPLDWVSQTWQPGQPNAIGAIVAAARDRLLANPGWLERLESFLGGSDGSAGEGDATPAVQSTRPRARCEATALEYAALGWPVIPLHSVAGGNCTCEKRAACPTPGKHPRTKNGVKDASSDSAVIARWFGRWPDANVGIATGVLSGLMVLDIDPRHGGGESLEELCKRHTALPTTLSANSGGGGRHLFFRCPEARIGNCTKLDGLPGLDLRGDGGYIVAAPSIHASGGSYSWVDGFSRDAVLPAPDWLCALASAKGRAGQAKMAAAPAKAGESISEGGRNDTLFRIGCGMRSKGEEADEILAQLLEINAARCEPPLGEEEIARIAQSAACYEPAPAKPDQPLIPIPADAPDPDTDHPKLGAAASVHTYRNSTGEALWHVCSFWDQGKLTTRPLTLWGDEEETRRWLWKGPGKRHVLYRLPELAAEPAAPVLVVRDEPSADQAAADFPGWAVTCPLFGTFGIRGAEWAALGGRQVLLWSDDTDEGRAFVKEAADQIRRAGAARVAVFAHDRRPIEGGGLANGGGDGGAIPTVAAGWTEAHLAQLFDASASPRVTFLEEMNDIRDNRGSCVPTAAIRPRPSFSRRS